MARARGAWRFARQASLATVLLGALLLSACGGGATADTNESESASSGAGRAQIAAVNAIKPGAADAATGNAARGGVLYGQPYLYSNLPRPSIDRYTNFTLTWGAYSVPKGCATNWTVSLFTRYTGQGQPASPWGRLDSRSVYISPFAWYYVDLATGFGGGSLAGTVEYTVRVSCPNGDPSFVEPVPAAGDTGYAVTYTPIPAFEYNTYASADYFPPTYDFYGQPLTYGTLNAFANAYVFSNCVSGGRFSLYDHINYPSTGATFDSFLAATDVFGPPVGGSAFYSFNLSSSVYVDTTFPQSHQFWGSLVCQNFDPNPLTPTYRPGGQVFQFAGSSDWPVITSQPSNAQAAIGATAVFSVGASGSGAARLSVAWQRNDDGVNWAAVGASSTFQFTVAERDRNAHWRAQVCAGTKCIYSNVVGLTLLGAPGAWQGDSVIAGAGQHSMAVSNSGVVWTWGSGNGGALGRPDPTQRPSPVPTLSRIRSVAAGAWYSTALDADGVVYAWGWGENVGDAIGSTNLDNPVPIRVAGLPIIRALATRYNHVLTLATDGTVWGFGPENTLALGPLLGHKGVRQVPGAAGMRQVAAGELHSASLTLDGHVWAWGRNDDGQLGTGADATAQAMPQVVPGIDNVVAIAASAHATFALRADGTVWSWGNAGEIGRSGDPRVPAQVVGLPHVDAIGAGHHGAWAWQTRGEAWGWGDNSAGQVGVGSADVAVPLPVRMPTFTTSVLMAGGERHGLGLAGDGRVLTWGSNDGRQLNGGPGPDNPLPSASGFYLQR